MHTQVAQRDHSPSTSLMPVARPSNLSVKVGATCEIPQDLSMSELNSDAFYPDAFYPDQFATEKQQRIFAPSFTSACKLASGSTQICDAPCCQQPLLASSQSVMQLQTRTHFKYPTRI
jgi:hypothetical protein